MSRLLQGVLIVAFVIVVNIVVSFMTYGIENWETEASQSSEFANCSDSNYTECENVGKTSFFSVLADVSFTGFDEAPLVVNAVWLSVMGLLLSAGILLIVLSFAPTLSA